MISLRPQPEGSIIKVDNDFNRITLSWKNPAGSIIARCGAAIFLIAWLGGWVFGEIGAIKQLYDKGIDGFLLFWLIAWTVGGLFAALNIFNLLRPPRPEKLVLEPTSLFFQKGTPSFNINWKRNDENRNPYSDLLGRKSKHTAPKNNIENIQIGNLIGRSRLTFDYGAERVEIGEFLREPEREWLFNVLLQWKGK